jgi:hypothetical protein
LPPADGEKTEIDDADIEHIHLWVSIMDRDGGTIEIIEQ